MSDNVCEEKVFQNVFNMHGEYLRNFLYYKCGDLNSAEDLMQDAFAKLWQECSKVSLEKAKSFLFTVGNNLFLNKVKHEKVVLKFEQSSQKASQVEDPQFLMEKEEFKKRLELAISKLPETQRVVFLMNRIDKKTYKEIAEILEISTKAVEKRMHKALNELRKIHRKV